LHQVLSSIRGIPCITLSSSMASVAMLMGLLQVLVLTPEVSSLSSFTDDGHKLKQHQQLMRKAEMAMGSDGRMEAKPSHAAATGLMKHLFPFYHTSDEMKKEVVRLSKSCGGHLKLTTAKDGDMSIDVVTVRKASAKPVNKVFILFGEHSRELISPESGLYFLRVLCGDVKPVTSEVSSSLLAGVSVAEALEDSEFQMVLNGNPHSRKKVENGDFCLRTNPDGVDLNRNWDEEWQREATAGINDESNPGPKPFSEPETRIFKKLVAEFRPTTFLTVHSGTRGMYMPWAYDRGHLAKKNGAAMMDVLKALDKDHCECPFGAAGQEVGYPCPGTCLDYAYDKLNTSYAFAFEIYTSADQDVALKQRWDEKMGSGGAALLQQGHNLGHAHFHDVFSHHTSDFVSLASLKSGVTNEKRVEDMQCFRMFNPMQKSDYTKNIQNWAQAYLQMSSMVAQKIKAHKASK